jgi:antitoxin component of RelBE/YafQ-DinJ toxin-antitoxin module
MNTKEKELTHLLNFKVDQATKEEATRLNKEFGINVSYELRRALSDLIERVKKEKSIG